jgi:hypothetical protein
MHRILGNKDTNYESVEEIRLSHNPLRNSISPVAGKRDMSPPVIEEPKMNMNSSIDSTHLRTNANFLVSDIMSKALTKVNDETPESIPGSVPIDKEDDEDERVVVDERARNVVDQILSNALFVVNNNSSS